MWVTELLSVAGPLSVPRLDATRMLLFLPGVANNKPDASQKPRMGLGGRAGVGGRRWMGGGWVAGGLGRCPQQLGCRAFEANRKQLAHANPLRGVFLPPCVRKWATPSKRNPSRGGGSFFWPKDPAEPVDSRRERQADGAEPPARRGAQAAGQGRTAGVGFDGWTSGGGIKRRHLAVSKKMEFWF